MVAGVPAAVTLTCPRCKTLRSFFNVDGGTLFRCGGCEWYWTLGTPAIATPAVPATTVNATNNTGTIIAATITGGTLTAVTVNGSQVGTTAGTYLVPAGGTINITYTVAPSWTWALPVINGSMIAGATAVPVASGGTYFTAGMKLFIDTSTAAEVLTVASGASATSIPVSPAALKAHSNGTAFGTLLISSTLGGVGEDQVPASPGWGF